MVCTDSTLWGCFAGVFWQHPENWQVGKVGLFSVSESEGGALGVGLGSLGSLGWEGLKVKLAPIGVCRALRRGGQGVVLFFFWSCIAPPSVVRQASCKSRGAQRMEGNKSNSSKSQQSNYACKTAASEAERQAEFQRLLDLQQLRETENKTLKSTDFSSCVSKSTFYR
jgi:hypothetical protein